MKHSVNICVSRDSPPRSVVHCHSVSIRERLLRKLLGRREKYMILVPGNSVDSVSITEVPEGGATHE